MTKHLEKLAKSLPAIIAVVTIGLGFAIYLLIGAAFDRAIEKDAEEFARREARDGAALLITLHRRS